MVFGTFDILHPGHLDFFKQAREYGDEVVCVIARNINVPGPDGDFGAGGKCLIKDINALIYMARENMYRPYLLEEVWRLNEKVRKNKDWLEIPGATSGNQDFEKKV